MEETKTDNTLTEPKGKRFKKSLLIVGGLALLMIIIIGGYFIWLNFFDPIAVINGEAITKKQFSEMLPKYTKIYNKIGSKEDIANIDEVAKKRMIEDKIIETESKKRNITVSTSEIEKEYKSMQAGYTDESQMISAYESNYGWSKEDIYKTAKIKLLKEKLIKVVVSSKDINSFLIYEYSGYEVQAKTMMDVAYQRMSSGEEYLDVVNDIASTPEGESPATYRGTKFNVTTENCPGTYTDTNTRQCDAIEGLKKDNEISKPVILSNGDHIIFHAKKVYGGKFASWQKFIDSFDKPNNIISSLVSVAYACKNVEDPKDITKEDLGRIAGNITDTGTNTRVGDHTTAVGVDNTTPGDGYCKVRPKDSYTGHEYSNYPGNKDTIDHWTSTIENGTNKGYWTTGKTLSCAQRWTVYINKMPTGYQFSSAQANFEGSGGWVSYSTNVVPNVNIPNKTDWAGVNFWISPIPTTTTPTSTPNPTIIATPSPPSTTPSPPSTTPVATITPPPAPTLTACTITLTTGDSACAIDETGSASATVTAVVSDAVSATLDFGDTGSTPISISNGTNTLTHTYPYGISRASASCTGTDGVIVPVTADFIAKDCPWRYCTASIGSTIAEDTGDDISGYIRTIFAPIAKYIKLDQVATFDYSELSKWDTPTAPSGGIVNVLSKNTDNPLSITEQVLFGRSSVTTKPSKFGSYGFGATGWNHGIVNPSNLLFACSASKTIQVKHPACTANEIAASAISPFTPPSFTASNKDNRTLTFSSKTTGISPDGGQIWKLERRTAIPRHSLSPVIITVPIGVNLPEATFTFRGDYSQESSAKYGPGEYKLTLLATSMANSSGYSADSAGDCNKTYEFDVVRGAEIKCTISPEKIGIAPQPIKLDIDVDSAYYNNSFKLIVNKVKPVSFTLKDSGTKWDGLISSYLKNAGKYYVAIEAERNAANPTMPNLKPCDDPSDSVLRYCGAGLCNYTVTNKDGGGGTEVAP